MTKRTSPYYDSSGRPQLTLAYCVLADVLGFQNMIAEALRKGQDKDLLGRLHSTISKFATDYADWDIKFFTDNVVMGQPTRVDDTSEGYFGQIIVPVMEYQLRMALEGFFLRGGFTIGSLFFDNSVVFGSALLKAHQIEQSVARDPRIVLSKDLLSFVKTHIGNYAEAETSPQAGEILIDSDGNAFINYLTQLVDYAQEEQDLSILWDGLKKHKQHIQTGLSKYRRQPEIWSKYRWLADYHNYFCNEVSRAHGYDKRLRIDSRLLSRRILRVTTSRK